MAALKYVDVPGYAAILFRRTFADLSLPGALMDRAREWLANTAAKWNEQEHTWHFPSGASITFGYLETENHKYRYQSAEFAFVGFDELTQFTETQYVYLFSRLRRLAGSDVPLRMRAASNPGGVGHEWVRTRFIDAKEPGRVFVSAKLADNPYLDQEEYRASLMNLDPVTREQLLAGNWMVLPEGAMFRREHARIIDIAPANMEQWVRYWDKAGCLAPGTRILTRRGEVPIESVTQRDAVWTRVGWKPVAWAGCTGLKQALTTVFFDDGTVLTGTPDHPILSGEGNWVALGAVSGIISAWQTSETTISKLSSSMAFVSPVSRGSDTLKPGSGTKPRSGMSPILCTEPFGGRPTVKSPLAVMSTTKTATGTTTTCRIWNVSLKVSITGSIQIASTHPDYLTTLKLFVRRLLRALPSIGSPIEPNRMTPFELPNFAPPLRSDMRSVLSAEMALNIERIERPCIVLPDAKTGHVTSGAVVYDLTVEGEHEFVANGAFVHNTEGGTGARTAGVLLGRAGSLFVVGDAITGRWSALQRRQIMRQVTEADGHERPHYRVWHEQEPGSGGKESAESTTADLAGYDVHSETVSGSKVERAQPFAAQWEAGNVVLLRGAWNHDYLDELCSFPLGALKDQVDASSGAFNKLAVRRAGGIGMRRYA